MCILYNRYFLSVSINDLQHHQLSLSRAWREKNSNETTPAAWRVNISISAHRSACDIDLASEHFCINIKVVKVLVMGNALLPNDFLVGIHWRARLEALRGKISHHLCDLSSPLPLKRYHSARPNITLPREMPFCILRGERACIRHLCCPHQMKLSMSSGEKHANTWRECILMETICSLKYFNRREAMLALWSVNGAYRGTWDITTIRNSQSQ